MARGLAVERKRRGSEVRWAGQVHLAVVEVVRGMSLV
jgi:hypothetical protein